MCPLYRRQRIFTCYLFLQLEQLRQIVEKSDKGNNSNDFHSRIMDSVLMDFSGNFRSYANPWISCYFKLNVIHIVPWTFFSMNTHGNVYFKSKFNWQGIVFIKSKHFNLLEFFLRKRMSININRPAHIMISLKLTADTDKSYLILIKSVHFLYL